MKTVSQLFTSSLLNPYLAPASGQSAGTTGIAMLNQVLTELYTLGDWRALLVRRTEDASAGYFCLPPDYEAVISVTINDVSVEIQSMAFEFRKRGTGPLGKGASYIYGLIDEGFVPLMSDIADEGADELIFSCGTTSFASGDVATVTYTDSEDGYTQTVMPLHAIAVGTASAVVSGGAGLTDLTVTSTAGLVVGMGVTITSSSGSDTTYTGTTFRISSLGGDSTSLIIDKSYVAAVGTLTITSSPTIMPANAIASVEEIKYAGLPARTMVKDADGVVYAILNPGDGMTQFRRYRVPQVPEGAADEWPVECLCKRAFIQLTSTSDVVYLDNIMALKHGMLAVIAEDNGDLERSEKHWAKAVKILSAELYDTRGGIEQPPVIELWGNGQMPLPSRF